MSASKKLTERQIAEQNEAKKVKMYTIIFAVVLVALIAVAIGAGINNSIVNNGIHEKNTIAVTVGDHKISNAELSYYYIDAVNEISNSYGITVDSSMADMLIERAVNDAQNVYAMTDAAKEAGFTLSEEQKVQLSAVSESLDSYASQYGRTTDAYVKAMYGNGADKASYLNYLEKKALAGEFYNDHLANLDITDDMIREADSAVPGKYSNYDYNQYILSVNNFLKGGTTAEDGTVTYSDEEKAAALEAAEAAAQALTAETVTSVEELDAAIAALDQKDTAPAASTKYGNQAYSSIRSELIDWVVDSARVAGDKTSVAIKTTSTDEAGVETENVTAIYVLFYNGVNNNEAKLVNARHILVSFDGQANEDGTYPDEVKEQAKKSAEEILEAWQNGEKTEDAFAALANEKSTDGGSNTNGGLYENIYPGQMVAAFNDWCFDSSRTAGDTGIVETNYGYHVMYFVGTADQSYRDYRITNDLRSSMMQDWNTELLEKAPVTQGDTSYMRKSF